MQYKVGAPNKCTFPICCRDNNPQYGDGSSEGSKPAGYWGDYQCDMPYWTVKNLFDYIGENLQEWKIDFITWNGDNSAHNGW